MVQEHWIHIPLYVSILANLAGVAIAALIVGIAVAANKRRQP